MRHVKWLVGLLFLLFACNICLGSSSPDVDIFFQQWSEFKRSYSFWEVRPWGEYNFTVKLVNNSNSEAYVHIWFTDGTVTNDEYKNRACLQDSQTDKFGKYISGNTDIHLASRESITRTYTMKIPTSYTWSGDIMWCITLSTSNSTADLWNLSSVSRKASFLDMHVVNADSTSPEIISHNLQKTIDSTVTKAQIKIKFSEPMNTESVKAAISMNGTFVLDWNADNTELTINTPIWFKGWETCNFSLWTRATDIVWNHLKDGLTLTFTAEKIEEKPSVSWAGWSRDTNWRFEEREDYHNAADNEGNRTDFSIVDSPYSEELNDAYVYAYQHWITTMETVQKADMDWFLLRKHLAKMISEFSIGVIWLEPNNDKICDFTDMADESEEMQYYAKLSCKLWLMWMHSDWVTVKETFDPNEYVDRAQFWTTLSRMLWWTRYANDDGNLYYVKHLNALYSNGIMNKIDWDWPYSIELRWRVMLMLMRIDQNVVVSNDK